MSSFFKGSCFIFWTTWLLCLSYCIGTSRFYEKHVINDPTMQKSVELMYAVALLNTVLAFVGCVFLKCNVNNICCSILYAVPVGVIVPVMSCYGAITISKYHKIPSKSETFGLVKEHIRSKNYQEAPTWLDETENEYKCCGINGATDYRKMFREFDEEICRRYKLDIPCSCCSHSGGAEEEAQTYHDESLLMWGCFEDKSRRCWGDNEDKKWMTNVLVSVVNETALTIEQKCTGPETFKVKASLVQNNRIVNNSGVLYASGCYDVLKDNYTMMKTSLLVFFIIFTICPLLMLIAYARYFCQSSVITGQRSDYSLDVDTLSAMEAPFANLNSANGMKQ